MMEEAREYERWGENTVVKFPMTHDGAKAHKQATEVGIDSNVTPVFLSNQALLAAKNGATYLAVSRTTL